MAGRESSTGALTLPMVTLGTMVGPVVQLVANGVAADPQRVGGPTQVSTKGEAAPLTVVGALQVSLGIGADPPVVARIAQTRLGVVASPLPVVGSKVSTEGGAAKGSATTGGIRLADAVLFVLQGTSERSS